MSIFKQRPKIPSQNDPSLVVDPSNLPEPQTAPDYEKRGYAFYARSRFPEAEADFKKAISLDPKAIDAMYALGMTYKAENQVSESIKTFREVIDLIKAGAVENRTRGDMLRRLALGHINELTEGDWNLEKEIWQKKE